MTPKTEMSPKMMLVAANLVVRGPMDARQIAEATGLPYHTARQYLRRLTQRGVAVVELKKFHPIYTAAPGLTVHLAPTASAVTERPVARTRLETTVASAIKTAPTLQTIWN